MKCEIKYAPLNLHEVIYPNSTVERRIDGYATGQLEGHIILHGPNGTGKTTLANLLIQAIGGDDALLDSDYDELLAKKDLRGYLMQSATLARLTTSQKYFLLLNEFDNATKEMSKFWTALDNCGNGMMAIITTNDPNRIHKSIRSRSDLIGMSGITAVAALPRVQHALKSEGLKLPDPQVLHYLKTKERYMDLRKYFKIADELLYLHSSGLSLPAWHSSKPALIVL